MSERKARLEEELVSIKKVLAELKVELLQHFGDAIALDGEKPGRK